MKKYFIFILLTFVFSCIDPYFPNLQNYESLLVVEGRITDENITNEIRLTRTFEQADKVPVTEDDASVFILDSDGSRTQLTFSGNGMYLTDSTLFTGKTGHRYTLVITTPDEKEYRSEECLMMPSAEIDSLYYEKGENISGVSGEMQNGLKIMLNSGITTGKSEYYRWTYEEVWKLDMPFPQQYKYSYVNPSTVNFTPLPKFDNVCWRRVLSSSITIGSVHNDGKLAISNQQIHFIAPLLTDRLTREYSIQVKQYSISKKEYEFWNDMKKVGEPAADIFASQPYPVMSNIQNVNDRNEKVLGYFGVSSVKKKRIFISSKEIDRFGFPRYVTDCIEIKKSPEDFPSKPPPTWDEIYHGYTDLHNYAFVKPEVKEGTILAGDIDISDLLKLVFTSKECAICDEGGFTQKPEYWIWK